MKTEEIPDRKASMWEPITNKHDLAALRKLIEETTELAGIAARCIIQGIDEANPDTGVSNRKALENEIADVYAVMEYVQDAFDLDFIHIIHRKERKILFRKPWFSYLRRGK